MRHKSAMSLSSRATRPSSSAPSHPSLLTSSLCRPGSLVTAWPTIPHTTTVPFLLLPSSSSFCSSFSFLLAKYWCLEALRLAALSVCGTVREGKNAPEDMPFVPCRWRMPRCCPFPGFVGSGSLPYCDKLVALPCVSVPTRVSPVWPCWRVMARLRVTFPLTPADCFAIVFPDSPVSSKSWPVMVGGRGGGCKCGGRKWCGGKLVMSEPIHTSPSSPPRHACLGLFLPVCYHYLVPLLDLPSLYYHCGVQCGSVGQQQ
ncbi:hypothetical protein E2C01_043048 [Portunus trituberculatus]|uniref:Uncharacterized protein n=1 Tax=Portunus trituberculatus TaxID=210409 RepID=A0A5B7FNF1_PORTR|nr:hypothetical protein [Portunus trituberculatus]